MLSKDLEEVEYFIVFIRLGNTISIRIFLFHI